MGEQQQYRSYLLRLWRTTARGAPAWRIMLRDVTGTQERLFLSLADMVAYLEQQVEPDSVDPNGLPPNKQQR